MKSNFISFLTLIKSIVTAVKIVLFYIHHQMVIIQQNFVINFLRNWFQYNETSLLFKIFMLLSNYFRNKFLTKWKTILLVFLLLSIVLSLLSELLYSININKMVILQQNFVINFLRNGFQYNKTSLLFKIFMLPANYFHNKFLTKWKEILLVFLL